MKDEAKVTRYLRRFFMADGGREEFDEWADEKVDSLEFSSLSDSKGDSYVDEDGLENDILDLSDEEVWEELIASGIDKDIEALAVQLESETSESQLGRGDEVSSLVVEELKTVHQALVRIDKRLARLENRHDQAASPNDHNNPKHSHWALLPSLSDLTASVSKSSSNKHLVCTGTLRNQYETHAKMLVGQTSSYDPYVRLVDLPPDMTRPVHLDFLEVIGEEWGQADLTVVEQDVLDVGSPDVVRAGSDEGQSGRSMIDDIFVDPTVVRAEEPLGWGAMFRKLKSE